jgi:hypothetical protein
VERSRGPRSEIFTPTFLSNRVGEPTVPFGAGEIPPSKPLPYQKLVLFTEHCDIVNYL